MQAIEHMGKFVGGQRIEQWGLHEYVIVWFHVVSFFVAKATPYGDTSGFHFLFQVVWTKQ
jgi:hypothetical protein